MPLCFLLSPRSAASLENAAPARPRRASGTCRRGWPPAPARSGRVPAPCAPGPAPGSAARRGSAATSTSGAASASFGSSEIAKKNPDSASSRLPRSALICASTACASPMFGSIDSACRADASASGRNFASSPSSRVYPGITTRPSQRRVGAGESRVEAERALVQVDGALQVLLAAALPHGAPLQVQLVGLDVLGRRLVAHRHLLLLRRELDAQLADDHRRDLVLHPEDVLEAAIVGLRPQVEAGLRVDQLRGLPIGTIHCCQKA